MDYKQTISTIIIIAIIILIYLSTYLQNKASEKKIKKMQSSIKKGDHIITYSGLSGVVDEIKEDRVILKLYPDDIKVSIEKWAIAGLDDRSDK